MDLWGILSPCLAKSWTIWIGTGFRKKANCPSPRRTICIPSPEGDFLLLTLRPEAYQKAVRQPGVQTGSVCLDVSLFDYLVLEELLGLRGGAADRGNHLHYVKDTGEGIQMVRRGEGQFAFFLNPVPIQIVQDLARQGLKMPHKSTYFYPKPLSGLVIHALAT